MDRITIEIQLKYNSITVDFIKYWFETMSYFKPIRMSGYNLTNRNTRKYYKNKFYDGIEKELVNDQAKLELTGDKNSIRIYKDLSRTKENIWLSCNLNYDIYKENQKEIMEKIDNIMIKYDGIVAYQQSLNDWFWQNNRDISMYETRGKSLDNVRFTKSCIFPDKDIVDLEYMPGHTRLAKGLWFGSCWMMWYGEEYYNYVSKDAIENFNDCYENKKISERCTRITLFEDPMDYDSEENRRRQWSFGKKANIYEIGKQLKESDKNISVHDPEMEINSGNFEHGGVRQIIYYYDEKKRPMIKSKANKKVTYELDKKGHRIWSKEESINM